MIFDDLAQVVCVQEFLDVEDAFHGGGVVSGAEEEVGESCVTEEQIAAEEVQCGVALLLLAWFHTKNCLEGGGAYDFQGHDRGIGKSGVGEEIGAIFAGLDECTVINREPGEVIQR